VFLSLNEKIMWTGHGKLLKSNI